MVRHPFRRHLRFATPPPSRASPNYAVYLSDVPFPLPRWTRSVHDGYRVSALPRRASSRSVLPSPLPRRVGVHIAAFGACSGFTRVTARRIARPPFRGLCHEASTGMVTHSCRSPAIESNHQLFEWVLPPLVFSPFGAHAFSPAFFGWSHLVFWGNRYEQRAFPPAQQEQEPL